MINEELPDDLPALPYLLQVNDGGVEAVVPVNDQNFEELSQKYDNPQRINNAIAEARKEYGENLEGLSEEGVIFP